MIAIPSFFHPLDDVKRRLCCSVGVTKRDVPQAETSAREASLKEISIRFLPEETCRVARAATTAIATYHRSPTA